MGPYQPKKIEPKWQKIWDKDQTYKANLNSSKPKYFAMSMLNYPSGSGIHIGHAMNYTISDVMARFKRQQGYESYHPIGWDAFGLPAENYAIKSGISPQASMRKIIPNYHKQYKAMGWSNDWSKEISTHEPKYYKWTQWIFSELYRNDLAYQASRMQWWCAIDNTVLADEQVTADGKCWRHDGPDDPVVEKREVKQWFFKITDYTEELLGATADLDWTESVKVAQTNWIGKSKGVEIKFGVDGRKDSIAVFTTRPDTIYGAAFLVLAPEHDQVANLVEDRRKQEVKEYQAAVAKKTEIERQASREKTGVFTGTYATNPASGAKLPIWIADFVLPGYGTGAVFADACDERDFEFAKKFDIPLIVTVVPEADEKLKNQVENLEIPYIEEGILVNSYKYTGMHTEEAREKITAELVKNSVAAEVTNYRLRDWSVGRQRYWGAPIPIIHCPKCGPVLVPDKDLPVVLPELKDFEPSGDGRSALARATDWLKAPCPKCGGNGERETDTLDTYVDSSWYFLRYLNPHDDGQAFDTKISNHWMPVDFYNGADHATAHMLYARFITRFFHKQGLIAEPEPFKKFLFNGKVVGADGKNFSKTKGNGPDPLDIINDGYGADALRTYLMFAAPVDQWVRWDPRGVPGTYRFLTRLWNLTGEFLRARPDSAENQNVLKLVNRTVAKVTLDVEHQKYNTAIAATMELINHLYLEKSKDEFKGTKSWRYALEAVVQLVAPFAPHIAEELWERLGHKDSVHIGHWPAWDEALVKEEVVTIVVQINGKLRATLSVRSGTSEEELVKLAKDNEAIKKHLAGKKIVKTITVKGKLVNFVAQ